MSQGNRYPVADSLDASLMAEENRTVNGCARNTSSLAAPWLLRPLLWALGGLRRGQLQLQLPNGYRQTITGPEPGPSAQLDITRSGIMTHLLRNGSVGFAEAYMENCWHTPDLTQLLLLLGLNEDDFRGPFTCNLLSEQLGRLRHGRRANTLDQSRRNISHHYDLGNDFYRAWLDETMAYSSAVFADPGADLHAGQLEKFRRMAERLQLRPEHELLEIGSGWGGFALYAARQHGCRVHSITLSSEQLAVAQALAQQEGLQDRVRFELRDYRNLQCQYDRIVSIEMIEAVGEAWWPVYFQTLHGALKPGGRAALQGITIKPQVFEGYRSREDFIQKYIFPGGMLAPPGLWMDHAIDAGLVPESPSFHGLDYARTLACWHQRFMAAGAEMRQMFDDRFVRMWRYYLSYCEAGFRLGKTDLMQLTLIKPTA